MRKVEYYIDECIRCPFFEERGDDVNYCHDIGVEFEIPDECGNDWFPKFCTLEIG